MIDSQTKMHTEHNEKEVQRFPLKQHRNTYLDKFSKLQIPLRYDIFHTLYVCIYFDFFPVNLNLKTKLEICLMYACVTGVGTITEGN